MPTSTFDRPIILDDPESVKKLLNIIESDASENPTPRHSPTDEELRRGEELFRECVKRSKG